MSDQFPFLAGGGEMGARMRAHDWSATSLGPPNRWPQSLRTMVAFCLNSPVLGSVLWGPELLMLYNDAYIPSMAERHPRALARPVSEVWGSTWEQVSPPFHKAMRTGEGFSNENVELIFMRNGAFETTYWDFSAAPIRGEDGQIAGLLNQGMETTSAYVARRDREAASARQRLLFDQMPGFVCVLNGPDHIYEYVNDAYVTIGGPRDYVGHSVRDVFPELEGQGFYELLDGVYQTGRRYVMQAAPIQLSSHPDPRHIDLLYEAIRDAEGAVIGIFVAGYDVSERHEAQVALRRNEERLEQEISLRIAERDRIWRNSRDVITVIDLKGVLTAVNPAASDLLGWSPEEMVGRNVLEFIHPEDRPPLRDAAFIPERYAEPRVFLNRFLRKDGGYYDMSWFSALSEDGHIYSSGRNITAEREQAAALKIAEETLRQSQKMEAVGQLTGGIAHDFNNLLAGISGSLELLERRLGEGRLANVHRYITTAQESTRRAASLTQRLLAFARRQTLDPRAVDVNRLVADMSDLLTRTVGPDVKIEIIQAGGLWTSKLDPSQLESALLNLCINARDAMAPRGGAITIETANAWLDDRAAKERELPPGQYVSLCVTDTGTGMTPDVIAKAFDPFFTTKPLGQGTGLGLSMIYGFVRQSGGQVRVYSEVGKGTTMCLYLPRHLGHAEPADDIKDSRIDRGEGETVLIIDDEPAVRMLVAEVLEEIGYRVLEASDGPLGLKILQSDARIDLLITDVGLPGGLNGRQVADAGRIPRPGLKVLFITGFAENAVVGNGHLDPGMSVITKPFAMSALANKVRGLIDSKQETPTKSS